ncbi:zinc finger protein 644 isoform X1 [Electrophorus electricus]|uniref:zinc finger protein 644 isoform X1 n=2 Tax=Electrophorus electricus TaxID=8005 RepID=UPI0015D05C9E|nr:zinc finger protein 644 isoform X1 [Electrophorus electricus]
MARQTCRLLPAGTSQRLVLEHLDGAHVWDHVDGACVMAAVRDSAAETSVVGSDEDHVASTNNNSRARPLEDSALASHQSLLNGAQPNPFIHDGIPAAPCPDDSLPPGAPVNGPASHRPSEESPVPNKDPPPWPRSGTSPQGLGPPSELPSDTRQTPEGYALEATRTRASSESDASDSDTLAGGDVDNRLVGSSGAREPASWWEVDSESSESSSDDREGTNGGLQEKFIRFLFKSRVVGGGAEKGRTELEGPPPADQRRRKQKTRRTERTPAEEEGSSRASLSDGDSDFDASVNEGRARRTRRPEGLGMRAGSRLGGSRGTAAFAKELVLSEGAGVDGVRAGGPPGGRAAPLKRRLETGTELEPSFSQCTKCDVTFKEKGHLHRHVMYHLERQGNRPRTFICRECGRSFCEHSSLQKHALIHQAQREKLMEEIKGLMDAGDEDPEAQLRCSPRAFATACPEKFVRHTRTLRKVDRHSTARWRAAHRGKSIQSFDTFLCKICTFRTKNRNVLRRHSALVHGQPFSDHKLQSHDMVTDRARSAYDQDTLPGELEAEGWPPLLLKPKFLKEPENRRTAGLSVWSNGLSDLYVREEDAHKSCKGLSSPLIKWSFGSLANNLSPSSLRCDNPSKLSLPTERIDATTGLAYVEEDTREYESSVSEQRTKYLTGFDVQVMAEAAVYGKKSHLNHVTSNGPRQPPARGDTASLAHRKSLKSPSKRKMSIPYHNTFPVLPKHEPASPDSDSDSPKGGGYDDANNVDRTNDANPAHDVDYHAVTMATTSDHYAQHGFPFKTEDSRDSADWAGHDSNAEDDDEIHTIVVKEESVRSKVGGRATESAHRNHVCAYTGFPACSVFEIDRKSCPYCPAVFESGVGLSNHVRGHLHRMGLSYEARHMLSPEQVASQDRQPRIRRRVPSMCKRNKRADKPESQTEHTCPLCLGWFDTKTGLSNHVRGHLKRIGKPISGISKSPLCILTELLQDEEERRNVLCSLDDRPHLSRPFISQKFVGSEGLFLTPAGVPVKVQRSLALSPELGRLPSADSKRRKRSVEEARGVGEAPSSTLVDLLMRRRLEQELRVPERSEAARTRLVSPRSKSTPPEERHKELGSTCSPEKFEINKKICIHCNATFHSAVSLSNHLRAYARRKRLAMLDGTPYDCNQKRSRSRPGPKRKAFSTPCTASDVTYTLACRFCDLVFQGPQSVQEDWVKHLQRHLMHTSVPGTGVGMVEVTAVCEDLADPSLEMVPLTTLTQEFF